MALDFNVVSDQKAELSIESPSALLGSQESKIELKFEIG